MQFIINPFVNQRKKMSNLKLALYFMRNAICFFAALLFSVNTFGNTSDSTVKTKIYHVNYPVITVLTVGLMTSDLFAVNRIKGKTKLSAEEFQLLNTESQRNLMNPIDRWGLKQKASDRTRFQKISDIGQVPIYLLPCLLVINKNIFFPLNSGCETTALNTRLNIW